MEIIKNERGGVKLCYEGYQYTKKSSNKTRVRWECSQRCAFSCLGSLTTDKEIREVIRATDHTHEGNTASIEATKARIKMKENVCITRGRPGQILADILQNQTVEVRAAIGKPESVKRLIRRQKQGNLPKDPASVHELQLPEEWTTTGEPYSYPFMFHDSGVESPSRMLVFGTHQALRHLCGSETWFMDGTHPSAPGIFKQVYIIRAPLGETAVTCVYALLSGKSQEVYEELFGAIVTKCEELGFSPDPLKVITDFEQASIRAIETTFGPHVQHQGCFYHLTQSTWRKIQDLALVELYKNDANVKLFCGMMDGLAFLPLEKVAEGMEYLKENTPIGLEGLLDYFDRIYVSGTFRRIQPVADVPAVRVRRIQPLFPPALWNVHQATLNNGARTNNICESWNHGFQKLIGYHHPLVWVIIESFRKDQAMVETAFFCSC